MTWGTKQRSKVDTTGVDPVGVDWVASHPPLEQPSEKIQCGEKQMEIPGSQKPCEATQMQQPSIEVWFVRNLWRCSTRHK